MDRLLIFVIKLLTYYYITFTIYTSSYMRRLFMEKEKILINSAEMHAIIERMTFQIIEKVNDYDNTYIHYIEMIYQKFQICQK